MAVERINSAADPRIAAYRDVRDGELLRSRGLFVAEGRFVVRRVIEDRRYRVESVLLNGAALKDLASTVATLARDVHVLVCDADTLAELTGYDVHRGCLALVHRPPATRADEVIQSAGPILILAGAANAAHVGRVYR